MSSMLTQLIYMSAATRPFASHELPSLLTKTRLKNEILGVSGMLVYHQGVFLQILEGKPEVVDALYERISADDRHMKCEVLLRCSVNHRDFADWSMGFINTNEFRNPRLLPGYQDFFEARDPIAHLRHKTGMAQKLLLAFREGALRQTAAAELVSN
jgi:hypothetical protein